MQQSQNMQWQKNSGYIYNSTDLGTITGVTITSSAGTFTTYYGTSKQPSSNTTVGGGFFQIKVGSATGTTSKIEVTFEIGGEDDTTIGLPSFSPTAGAVNYGTEVTLTAGTNGTGVLYTLDGTDPSYENDATEIYDSPIPITAVTTITAVSVDDDDNLSEVATASYTLIPVDIPTFSPAAGAITAGTKVTINKGSNATDVLYTLDGSTPTYEGYINEDGTLLYESPIEISVATTIKAICIDAGNRESEVVTASYTIATTQTFALVTDASSLADGDQILIVNTTDRKAMSTEQKNYNRGATGVTITDNTITIQPTSDVQILTLEGSTGAWYFNTGSGYLYAASSSNNYLRTENEKDNNAKATITINNSNNASITFQGSNTRNYMLYNTTNNGLFACYTGGTSNIQLYRLESGEDPNLAFSETTKTYRFGDGAFTEPTLTKAEGVPAATYTSSNTDVAEVDAATGKVTIKAAGSTKITATTEKTDDFRKGTASYTLTVEKGDPALAYETTSYEQQVNDVFATPALTNVLNVTVAYTSSDETVATVDASTGAVTILSKRGTVTITAAFDGNDQYTASTATYTIKVTDPAIVTTTVAGTLFYESFNTNTGTGGNDGSWGGSIASSDIQTDNNGWSLSNCNGASKCLKAGTSKAGGSATTPALGMTGDGTLTFKAAAWDGSNERVTISVSIVGNGSLSGDQLSEGIITLEKGSFTNFTLNVTGADENTKIRFSSSQGNNRFFLDEVKLTGNIVTEAIRNTVSSAEYATLYFGNYNLVVPENVEAYTIKQNSEQALVRSTTYETGDVIPAGTAVVVHGAASIYEFLLTDEAGTADEDNLLRGSDVAELTTGPVEGTAYKFYMLSLDAEKTPGSVGFYFNKDDSEGGAFMNGAHKAYLALEKDAGAKSCYLFSELEVAVDDTSAEPIEEPGTEPAEPTEDETVTGIRALREAAEAGMPMYNLQGQRVGRDYRGIVIVNGRKFKK